MNFLHYGMGNVSRSSGRSAVQAVAYITREELFEERRGIRADYTNIKDHEVFWETLSPEGSGIAKDDLTIWNKAEAAEDEILTRRYKDSDIRAQKISSAVPAYSDRLALPKELSLEENIELSREFLQTRYVDRGLVATYSIHLQEGNPHLHFVYSARQYQDGKFSDVKTASRETRGPKGGYETRIIQCDIINKYQERAGITDRVDPRPYVEIGNGKIATLHKGYHAHQMDREGIKSRIGIQNELISKENKERLAEEPGFIIKELTAKQATFSENEVVRLMQDRLKDDMGILGQHVFHEVMKQSVEVGKNIHEQVRYTSQEYFDKEARILESFDDYRTSKASIKIDSAKVDEFLGKLEEQSKDQGFKPTEGQINGIKTLCGDSQVSVLIGRAGTGKTTTMKSVVKLHQDAGYKVIGMAPSATAASQLEADTGCKSDTIAHYAYYWREYDKAIDLLHAAKTDKEMRAAQNAIDKYASRLPNSETLILIDEAGMVEVGDHKGDIPGGWDAITRTIDSTGAKLILTGDDHQRKPVGSGDVFRRLVHDLKGTEQFCELSEIKRQNIPWMRDASGHLAEFNISTALGMYEREGYIQQHDTKIHVYEDMARQYLRNIISQPDSTGMVIAETNEERHALNREIRSILKENGLLPKEDLLRRGDVEGRPPDGYTVGDKIIFTKNDRGWNTKFESPQEGFFVRNNMLAVIQSIKPIQIKDKDTGKVTHTHEIVAHVPDHKATIWFNLNDYKNFAHSYAVTGWKSQGNTLDWVLLKVSKSMKANALYVALTRHRDNVWMYYSKEDFPDYKALVHSLSKVDVKDLVVDYSVSEERKEFWQNVQDYKDTGRELHGIGTLIRNLEGSISGDEKNKEKIDAIWANFRDIEADRKSWAKHILGDWEEHKDFVRQAGLSRESLEIVAGLKKRSLSRVEMQAQVVVEQYVACSLEARELWRDIRKTHPGVRAKSHSDWKRFEEVRDQRGVLANHIYLNPILHRPFLKETANSLNEKPVGYVPKNYQKVSYSMGTIKVQAESHQSMMLQRELLKDNANPVNRENLKVLIAYTENRDMAGGIWQEVKPKLKEFEGTLLKESFSKAIAEYTQVRKVRDAAAFQIMGRPEEFRDLAEKVGIKLDFDKLKDQAVQATRDRLLEAWQFSPEQMTKLGGAFELNELIKGEAGLDKKPTLSFIYSQGAAPKDIVKDALEYQKIKLFEGLKTESDKGLFLLLDEYDANCRKANQLYGKCIEDVKGKEGSRPWHSSHYEEYKAACAVRNTGALEIFDQRDQTQVLSMAEAMGIKFKEVELQEIFSRSEQATRTNHIISYINAEDFEKKGQAAVALQQMIAFERGQDKDKRSVTAIQAYHAGIDFKELRQEALEYGRAVYVNNITNLEDKSLFHTLTTYESTSLSVKQAYKECIEESKARSTASQEFKPWETEKFKDYLSLVKVQDEQAYELIKEYKASSVDKISEELGISTKRLDVEAHRHSLRQTLQTFTDGDRTNVAMAANEILNWLEFDRHSDHKHTFKILREQDVWPKEVQNSLNEFFDKKRELRQEDRSQSKRSATPETQSRDRVKSDYTTITYKRQLSFMEVDQQLKYRMLELSTHLLGNPTSRTANQLRFGRKGSICVFTNGPKQGLYANHESGMYGGPLKLIEEQAGLTNSKEARDWAIDWLGGKELVVEQRVTEKVSTVKQSTWTPITPVPKGVENPDIVGNKYLNIVLKDGAKETLRHAYRDAMGNLRGYVIRIEKEVEKNGKIKVEKINLPLAYCQNEKGFKAWKWQGFDGERKIPYGIEKLAQDSTKPILVVEGEKTADAAQKLLPNYHVLTWIIGAGNVGKTNWECLAGKEVTIWPDYDYDLGGLKAAQKLQQIVTQINQKTGKKGSVGIVELPTYVPDQPALLPDKWDLADKLPEGWTLDTVKDMIKDAAPIKDKGAVLVPEDGVKSDTPEKIYTPQEKEILTYLRQELTSEKTPWLQEADFRRFLKAAEENPTKTLQRWQSITDDYTFNAGGKERKPVEGGAPDRVKGTIKDEPFVMNDEQKQAQSLLASVHDLATQRMLKDWQNLVLTSPNEVIEGCNKLIQEFQGDMEASRQEARCEIAANKFLSLCNQYEGMQYSDPERKSIKKEIDNITSSHLKDELFLEKINSSRNEIAIKRINQEIDYQNRSASRGMSMDR